MMSSWGGWTSNLTDGKMKASFEFLTLSQIDPFVLHVAWPGCWWLVV